MAGKRLEPSCCSRSLATCPCPEWAATRGAVRGRQDLQLSACSASSHLLPKLPQRLTASCLTWLHLGARCATQATRTPRSVLRLPRSTAPGAAARSAPRHLSSARRAAAAPRQPGWCPRRAAILQCHSRGDSARSLGMTAARSVPSMQAPGPQLPLLRTWQRHRHAVQHPCLRARQCPSIRREEAGVRRQQCRAKGRLRNESGRERARRRQRRHKAAHQRRGCPNQRTARP